MLQSETFSRSSDVPTVGRRLGSETWAALQFTVPLLLRHNSLYNPTGMHFFFFLFFCIICIMSEHQNTAHLGCFCTYSQRFANWSCTIQKCVHFCYCWKIKNKKRDCNDSTVWATSRWQQSLRHLTMRLLKTLQKKKKDLHSRETHCILNWFILLCPCFVFLFCCLSIDVVVYLLFKCVVSELLWWYIFMQILVCSGHFSLSPFFFHVWIKLLFITQTCWTFFFFF